MSDARRLKIATGELVKGCGNLVSAAADVGKGKTTVHRWTDENNADDFVNVRDLAVLERVAGTPFVTRILCRLAGGVFMPLPDIAPDSDSLAGMIMRLSARLGEISGEMARALCDGIVDQTEARRLLDLQAEHDAVAAQLRHALERIADGSEQDE
jgi:hypothetical protein